MLHTFRFGSRLTKSITHQKNFLRNPLLSKFLSTNEIIKNEKIKFEELRVVFDSEQQEKFGFEEKWKFMTRDEALDLAEEHDLDLILVNDAATPPVCKYGNAVKLMMDQKEKQKERRQKVKSMETKEVVLGALIDKHDLTHKMNKIISFLDEGRPVKLTITVKPKELKAKPTCVDETCLAVFDILEESVGTLNSSKVAANRREFLLYPKPKTGAGSSKPKVPTANTAETSIADTTSKS